MSYFGVESRLNNKWELIPQSIRSSKHEAESFAKELDECVIEEAKKFITVKNKFRVIKMKNKDVKGKLE